MENNFTQDEINKIIDMYKNNISIDGIADKYNCKEKDLRLIFKEHQIDRHGNWRTKELDDRISYYYLETNLKQYEIADILCVSENGIKSTINRLGLPTRTVSQQRRRFERNQHFFDYIDTPNKAYILGILYADGCNFTERNAIQLHLQEDDYYLLLRIKLELEYEGELRFNNLHDKNVNYKNQYILCIYDEHMSKQLIKLGVVPKKSLILNFPTENQVPKEYISHFIRGYFDGDGCISCYNEKYTTRICGTKEFISGISNIMNEIGINHCIVHPKQSGESNTFVLQTNGNKSTYQLMNWLYKDADIKMDRKYYKYLDLCNQYKKSCINLI